MDKKRELQKIATQIKKSKCPLSKSSTNPVPGEGPANAKIMFIGAAPGRMEDLTGKPFVGRSGKFLTKLMNKIGLRREKVFITSVEKHFPPKNRPPKKKEIETCKPYLIRQLEIISPEIVVLLGKTAETVKNEHILKNKKILITAHPSAGMRFPKIAQKMRKDFQKLKQML
ncbi:MAG TPA: uracil-DNA glycosylase [Candidatus Nanoarchaeia archaeon]|nr:uracil-DNA glycosylase [Candidatus Nanoarchaeia archaeon]